MVLSWSEWSQLDAVALAELIRADEISPREAAQQAVEAIELLNPELNAVLEVFDDAIEDPDSQGMDSEGAFFGVPLLVKDSGSRIAGRLQEGGTLLMKGNRAERDDPFIRNLRRAGFNLIGRSAVPPFSWFAMTESLINGVTRNPWNPDYTSGGSSGGATAAVAARIMPMASASDGAGSIRSPASWTGLIGLKHTRGRTPLREGANELTDYYVSEGVVSRTVRDTANALPFLYQKALGESFIPISALGSTPSKSVSAGLKIALNTGTWGCDSPIAPEIVEHLNWVGDELETLGHTVTEVDEGEICDVEVLRRGIHGMTLRVAMLWEHEAEKTGIPLSQDTMEPVLYWVQQLATQNQLDIWDYWELQAQIPVITRQFGLFFEQYDMLLTPNDPVLTPKAGVAAEYSAFDPLASLEDAEEHFERLVDVCRYCGPSNQAGYPSLSLPSGQIEGLPIGFQLSAAWGQEELLLTFAKQIESGKPEWFDQIAPVSVSTVSSDPVDD